MIGLPRTRIGRAWQRWRRQRACFHGEPISATHPQGTSWVRGQLIDLGRRKLFSCGECGRRWVV